MEKETVIIKSKEITLSNEKRKLVVLRDSITNEPLEIGYFSTIDDYTDECVKGTNECAMLLRTYKSHKNNIVYVWYDWEIDETYISYSTKTGVQGSTEKMC